MFRNNVRLLIVLILFVPFFAQAQQDVLLIDMGSDASDAPWNNVLTPATGEVTNLLKSDGTTSGYGVKVFDAFSAVNTTGTTNPDAALNFPSTATGDSFYGNVTEVGGQIEPTGGLEFYHLKPEKLYTFTIFASRDALDNRETKYELQGATQEIRYLNPSSNTADVVVATLKPNEDGIIQLTASPGPNNNTEEQYFYLGCIKMEYEHEEVLPESCPIVIIGSSTAAGNGLDNPADSWAAKYTQYLQTNQQYSLTNLAQGGFTTYHVLPTGTPIPDEVDIEINEDRNITKALTFDPFAIIVNLPSNDASLGFSVQAQLDNYDLIVQEARNQGVKVWVCTPQPVNFGDEKIAKQIELREAIINTYGPFVLDFWTGLATEDGHLKAEYDSGDGTHLNELGHDLLYHKVVAARITNASPCLPLSMGNLPPETVWGVPQDPSDIPMPGYLQQQHDEEFDLDITRLVDSTVFCNEYGGALSYLWQNHQYSKIQAWNADKTHLFFGSVFLINAEDYSIEKVISGGGRDARWSNVEPNIRFNCFSNQLRKTDVYATPVETTVIHTFEDYDQIAIGPWEGNLSQDDHYVVIANVIDDDYGNKASIYDIWTDQVLGTFEGNFDWASVTPSGQYVVVSNNKKKRVEVYNLNFEFQYVLIEGQEHGDFAVDINGEEVFVQVIPVSMIRLRDAFQVDLLPATDATSGTCGDEYYNPHIDGHVSGRNFDLPGWAYVSAGVQECEIGYEWRTELFAVKLDYSGTGAIRHFGHSRGKKYNGNTSPIATVSQDGSKVLFFSNWDMYGQGLHEGPDQYRHMTFLVESAQQPLPIEFTDFTAFKVGTNVSVKWNTLSEKENKGFFVQRSVDGVIWEDLGFVKGQNESNSETHYQFLDTAPHVGLNNYRLLQIDNDGQQSFSSIVNVFFDRSQIFFYPNPASKLVYINTKGKKLDKLLIFNNLGQVVISDLSGKTEIDISALSKGIYWIFAQANGQILREKLLVE